MNHPDHVEHTLAAAAVAAPIAATLSPAVRRRALSAAADALTDAVDELAPLAVRETGLAGPRLRGEIMRTATQLRMFAELAGHGELFDVLLDEADPDFALGLRPDIRRMRVPLGVVLVFAASNFPFAFSVAGGDTASALAAGNTVVVKAHPGHLEVSRRVVRIVGDALVRAGMPEGILGLVEGDAAGITALQDPRVRAAGFTGSTRVGTMLAAAAAARPTPIPFYGELGSVNPVIVTPARAAEGIDALAIDFVASVSGSAGQLCTKPGLLFIPSGFAGELAAAAARPAAPVPAHRLLTAGIADGYAERRTTVITADGVAVLVAGALHDEVDGVWVTPTLAHTTLAELESAGSTLLDEVFGPFSLVVEYDGLPALTAALPQLVPGALAAGVHSAAGEDSTALRALVSELEALAGRVLFDGWPTGVAVTPAMHHGGPFPSTTVDATSVGADAARRFQRAVVYQDAPSALLPEPLRDDNPWGVPQRRSPRGASVTWGAGSAS